MGRRKKSIPSTVINRYEVKQAEPKFKPVDFTQMYDAVSGDEFTFVRGRDNSKYLDYKAKINKYRQNARNGDLPGFYNSLADSTEEEMRNDREALEDYNFNQQHGITSGQAKWTISNNRINIDDPKDSEHEKNMVKELSLISSLSDRMRELDATMETMIQTDPMLVKEHQGLISSYREAKDKALARNFDIRKNGIQEKLKLMGLDNSSTALGMQIQLQRDKYTEEVNNRTQLETFASNHKKESLINYFNLGKQRVGEINSHIGLYGQHALNDFKVSQKKIAQAQLRRQTMMGAMGVNVQMNTQALQALSQDNMAMYNKQANEIDWDKHNNERWKLQQIANINPAKQAALKFGAQLIGRVIGGEPGSKIGGEIGDGMGKQKYGNPFEK